MDFSCWIGRAAACVVTMLCVGKLPPPVGPQKSIGVSVEGIDHLLVQIKSHVEAANGDDWSDLDKGGDKRWYNGGSL